ncbi:DNA-directed RNA polymerase subunit alpha C-terminal domain-containing protein [Nonomuraea endophytica]|uniref:DNA-directed RNA polymerase alpha subunit n=1 Tax=Nonomuraea endophytica TaxID=714136 RepID=A0A7W8EK33_9ACTN|nr:DNA-directed RNA polymerase subunit alpha C-terminal domain-containing protein [Nonomuraea endophytica]MBB5081297.1 DNA-directed RNA polymerase alpha subunit [Nonomuraea endophytica]
MSTLAELVAATGLPASHPIRQLPSVTWHIANPLDRVGIRTLGDLADHCDDEMLRYTGFGPGRLTKLKEALATLGGGA